VSQTNLEITPKILTCYWQESIRPNTTPIHPYCRQGKAQILLGGGEAFSKEEKSSKWDIGGK
ncbi:hypothetical protein LINPERPRIM_LOCUS23541, partial [Linum perenne]